MLLICILTKYLLKTMYSHNKNGNLISTTISPHKPEPNRDIICTTVKIIMEFEHFSDPELAYMYHCHILEHEDNGMMGQFVVE